MAIYVEMKNGVIVPTIFENGSEALEALNAEGGFIGIGGQSYNKFEIKRTFEMTNHPILLKMSQQPYDKQLALWSIAKQRQKEGKPTRSFEQLEEIYEREKTSGGLSKYSDLPFFAANDGLLSLEK